jgi:hypothetical protein
MTEGSVMMIVVWLQIQLQQSWAGRSQPVAISVGPQVR